MSLSPLSYVANFDSATGMLRALGHFLNGQDFPAVGQSQKLKPLAVAVNWLPPRLREQVYTFMGAIEAVSRKDVGRIDAEAVSRWMVSQYPERCYPAVAVGSSSGALVHLCAALGMPWLPQTYLIPVRQPYTDADEPKRALALGRESGRRLLESNPDLQLHHMHDPNQDRLMVRYMTYFRVKRRRLGEAYERFLIDRLEPGGTIILSECRRTWPTTRIGERHVFQFGALGGATEEEFFKGSDRVAHYLAKYGSCRRRWDPPQPNGRTPEAEWGFEPTLRDDVEAFARRHGYRVARIVFEEPEHLSPLVADLYRWWYRMRRIPANRLLAESFIVMEPYWALRTGSVPFWMKFNMMPSADWLEQYLTAGEPFDDVNLMLFSNGIEGAGWAPIERWRRLFRHARRKGSFLGIDERKFPRDFATFAQYHPAIRNIPARYPLPGPLSFGQFGQFLEEAGKCYSVEFENFPEGDRR
ncbi:hypothetical protein [Rhodospirillaceae bacterium SYSU D60014]|uniref:hypothetical protein n=1 Tax=Virgifigura deserti TaxID=2268457 RepID=UPI000E671224